MAIERGRPTPTDALQFKRLTNHEIDILKLAATGRTQKEVCAGLPRKIAVKTLKSILFGNLHQCQIILLPDKRRF